MAVGVGAGVEPGAGVDVGDSTVTSSALITGSSNVSRLREPAKKQARHYTSQAYFRLME